MCSCTRTGPELKPWGSSRQGRTTVKLRADSGHPVRRSETGDARRMCCRRESPARGAGARPARWSSRRRITRSSSACIWATATSFVPAEAIASASFSTRGMKGSRRTPRPCSNGASPGPKVGRFRSRKGTTTILSVYSTHLACLLPLHGPGVKHERDIVLEGWQTAIVDASPWTFLRGLIRSDGCVFVNRTGRYEYVSSEFSNRSAQIRDLSWMRAIASMCRTGRIADTCGSTDGRAWH